MRTILVKMFSRILSDRRGGTAIEYGLIISLVVLTMIGALMALAETTSSMWNTVSSKVETTTPHG